MKVLPVDKDDFANMNEGEREDAAGFTKDYLQRTSLHGLQYIGENNRSLFERIFWVISFTAGAFTATYFILGLWDKWDSNPVYVSVETTSYPVPNLAFPAVSICSVNKLQEEKLMEALESLQVDGDDFDSIDHHTLYVMLEGIIDFESVNIESHSIFSANEDQDTGNYSPAELLKVFKKSMQSCTDMIMHCQWMGQDINCMRLFKVMPTDDGFCCVFNALKSEQIMREDKVALPDEYGFLDDTDYFDCDDNGTDCTTGWSGGASIASRKKREATDFTPLETPQYASGAGVQLGLTVMLYADKNKYFLTPSSLKGFKALVHNPEVFPEVREKGFAVGTGLETFVALDAIDVYSTSAVRDINVNKRKCYFPDERPLNHYLNYTRSNCLMECLARVVNHLCGCQPYYLPVRGANWTICGLYDVKCLRENANKLRMLSFPNDDFKEELENAGLTCDCPSSCSETRFSVEISSAPYPNQIASRRLNQISPAIASLDSDFFEEETALLHIFFKNEFILQYKRDTLYGINDFISNMGGLMGLCMGFSLLSGVEIFYWFLVRLGILLFTKRKQDNSGQWSRRSKQKELRVKSSKAFDELFKGEQVKVSPAKLTE